MTYLKPERPKIKVVQDFSHSGGGENGNNCQSRILYPVKVYFRNKGEILKILKR